MEFLISQVKDDSSVFYAYETLKRKGYIDDNDDLSLNETPFNVFARFAAGIMPNPVDQTLLEHHQDKFMICHNRKENDDGWNNPEHKPGSMAGPDKNGPGHVFITTKDLSWRKFNILPIVTDKDFDFLERLKSAALTYAKNRNWTNPAFFVHCFPDNSVQSFHLHVINMDTVGVHYEKHAKRNIHLQDILDLSKKKDIFSPRSWSDF